MAYKVEMSEFMGDLAPYENIYAENDLDDLGEFKAILDMLGGGGALGNM